jgi:hypothetical protein
MGYKKELFDHQYPVVVFFVQHIAYYRGLRTVYNDITQHREFWRSTCNGHLELATLAWCNVFGSYKEDMHWTKTPAGKMAEEARKDFRDRVLCETGLTQEQWERYHQEMLDFRDKSVAHLDLRDPFDEPIPRFDTALHVANAYQEWARDLIKPVLLNQPTLISQYEHWEADARSAGPRRPRS